MFCWTIPRVPKLMATTRNSVANHRGRQGHVTHVDVRLHHFGCRIGWVRPGEQAVGASGQQGAADRSRRYGLEPVSVRTQDRRPASHQPQVRVALRDIAVRAQQDDRGVASRQGRRGIQCHQRAGVQPRHPGGLRRPRAPRQRGVGLGFHAARLQGHGGQRVRALADSRRGRPAHDQYAARGGHPVLRNYRCGRKCWVAACRRHQRV
jgi:hypothetical protein